ncbi:MAG: hypothetical protein Q9179_007490, partial [Wetmoreana sp. 5 TL-2023]
ASSSHSRFIQQSWNYDPHDRGRLLFIAHVYPYESRQRLGHERLCMLRIRFLGLRDENDEPRKEISRNSLISLVLGVGEQQRPQAAYGDLGQSQVLQAVQLCFQCCEYQRLVHGDSS